MDSLNLDELWRVADLRMRELGWNTAEWQERLRNQGAARTPDKRHMLARMSERARDAGLEPLKAY